MTRAVSISLSKAILLKQASKHNEAVHLKAFGSHFHLLMRICLEYRKALHLHPLSHQASNQFSLDLK